MGEASARYEEVTMLLRWMTAAAVVVSGAVHLVLWWEGYRDIAVIGPLFLLNAVAALVIGVAVIAWRHWLPLVAAVGFGASTLGAFVLSTTVGLFGVHEVWSGTEVLLAAASEAVAVLAGVAALLREGWLRRVIGQTRERHARTSSAPPRP
jgi:hypothetical protein